MGNDGASPETAASLQRFTFDGAASLLQRRDRILGQPISSLKPPLKTRGSLDPLPQAPIPTFPLSSSWAIKVSDRSTQRRGNVLPAGLFSGINKAICSLWKPGTRLLLLLSKGELQQLQGGAAFVGWSREPALG